MCVKKNLSTGWDYEVTWTFARKLQMSWFEMKVGGQARKVRSYEGGRRPPEKICQVYFLLKNKKRNQQVGIMKWFVL